MSKGLIFEGGGMRGVFATGVVDYLLEKDVYFDNVLAVSAGACHACSYVCGQKGRAFDACTTFMDDKEYASLQNLKNTGNYFGSDFIYHRIPEELFPIDNEAFHRRGIKFQAVVTNCVTGEAEYPVIEDMLEDVEWIRGSASLPLLSQMVPVKGGAYMDGGIADSIPLAKSIEQGNEKNVIIMTRPRDYRKKPNVLMPVLDAKYKRYPKLLKALRNRHKVYNETLDLIEKEEAAGRAFVIAPMGTLDIGRLERNKEKLHKAYTEGYYVTEGLYDKLAEFLGE